jgi:hypothetical protein
MLFCRKGKKEEEEEIKARRHYSAAKVEEIVYNIGDDVYVTVIKCTSGWLSTCSCDHLFVICHAR